MFDPPFLHEFCDERYAGNPAFKLEKAWTATCNLPASSKGHGSVERTTSTAINAISSKSLKQFFVWGISVLNTQLQRLCAGQGCCFNRPIVTVEDTSGVPVGHVVDPCTCCNLVFHAKDAFCSFWPPPNIYIL